MNAPATVRVITFAPASPADQRTGLMGWVQLEIADLLRLDGVAIRRTRTGRITLSFPRRIDSKGGRHALVRPIDDGARRVIEDQVFEALGRSPGVTS